MTAAAPSPLETARQKTWWRILPLLFFCYVIAYVDRTNVSIAKLTMVKDLPAFDNAVIGFGAGVFFLGYFLLEIPGTVIVERWSARKWICRIMITWGIMAALTALVKTPMQFYVVRFLLGLAEAGFFPGAIVVMTHWFTARDRGRALALFMIASPVAQMISPKISNALLQSNYLGLSGWQWVYIFWGIPAVILGIIVFFGLTDRPKDAKWLSAEEREALQKTLDVEKQEVSSAHRIGFLKALAHPKVLLLAVAYFCVITGHYGVEIFMPSILKEWYSLTLDTLTWIILLPPLLGLIGQLALGWSSDYFRERRLHVVAPILLGAIALGCTPLTHGNLALTVICFMLAFVGIKSFLPIFWTLPSLFLTDVAAAGSIGLINSIGNLGGYLGPSIVGKLETVTGSFNGGIYFLAGAMLCSAATLFALGLGSKAATSVTGQAGTR
jgi:MFS transporter, ACS family, tartrate transporter